MLTAEVLPIKPIPSLGGRMVCDIVREIGSNGVRRPLDPKSGAARGQGGVTGFTCYNDGTGTLPVNNMYAPCYWVRKSDRYEEGAVDILSNIAAGIRQEEPSICG